MIRKMVRKIREKSPLLKVINQSLIFLFFNLLPRFSVHFKALYIFYMSNFIHRSFENAG